MSIETYICIMLISILFMGSLPFVAVWISEKMLDAYERYLDKKNKEFYESCGITFEPAKDKKRNKKRGS